MRDPVDRIKSQVSYSIRKSAINVPLNEEDLILRFYKTKAIASRTRYENTIKNIESIFNSKNILYAFYETLFQESSIQNICNFLGLDFIPANFQEKFNVSKTEQELDLKTKEMIYIHYKTTYEFIAEKFGKKFMQSIWYSYESNSK